MADDKIRIEIQVDTDKGTIKKSFDNIEKEAAESGENAGQSFGKNFGKFALAAGAAGAALLVIKKAADAVASAFSGSIAASIQQEDALNALNASLANIGEFTQETSKDLQNFASQLQATTRFGDEAVLSQLAFAQAMGATAEQSKTVVAAAADLAAGLNIDLNAATRNVAKTLGGFAGELGEVIPELKNLTAEQLRAGAGVELLAQKFQGLAQTQIRTFSGAVAQTRNAFGDLLEGFGNFITQSPTAIALINQVGRFLAIAANRVKEFAANTDIIGSLVSGFVIFGQALNRFVVAPLELGVNLVQTAFAGIQTGVAFLTEQVIGAAQKINGVLSAIGVNTGLGENLALLAEETTINFEESFADFEESKNRIFDFSGALKAEEFLEKLNSLNEGAAKGFKALSNNSSKLAGDIGKDSKRISTTLNQGLAQGLSNTIQQVATNLAQGKGLFDDFGRFILGVLGDLAIQVGNVVLAMGIALSSFGDLTGTSAIIAGAALIAVGSILKAFASGPGLGVGAAGAAAPGAGGVGGVPVSDTGDAFGNIQEQQEERQTEQRVTVNIQGDVLDVADNDLGTRLVQILNDAFETNGVVVTNGSFA